MSAGMNLPRQSTDWRLVGLLLVAGLFGAAQFGKLTLTLDLLRDVYPAGGALVPVLISIVGAVGIVFGAVAGALVARAGLSRAILAAMILGGVVSLVQVLLPPLPVFAVLRVIEGISHLVIVVAAPTLMASAASDADRPIVMGIWASFFGVSLALTALGLPYVLPYGGLPLLLGLHGAGFLLIAGCLFAYLPSDPPRKVRPVSYVEEHARIYTSPRLVIAGAGFVWYTVLYIALLAVLPGALDLPIWAVSGLPLVSLAGTLGSGVLARKIAPHRIVITGFCITIVMVGAVSLSPYPLPWTFALFLCMGVIPGGSFAGVAYFNDTSLDRARATGGIAQLGNVGTTFGTPVFVLAASFGGVAAIGLVTTVFCLIGATVLIWLGRRIAVTENKPVDVR